MRAVQESTSFFTRKKKMTVPPKKITGIIDGLKQVYFSKVGSPGAFLWPEERAPPKGAAASAPAAGGQP